MPDWVTCPYCGEDDMPFDDDGLHCTNEACPSKKEFVSASCFGERCYCGAAATKRVEETIFHDDPNPSRWAFKAYLCTEHFDQIMGGVRLKPR